MNNRINLFKQRNNFKIFNCGTIKSEKFVFKIADIFKSFLYRKYIEWAPWVGLSALVVYVMIQVLECTFWLRVP